MYSGFAILGAGIFAKEAYLPALAKLDIASNLKAIYSRSERSASELAAAAQDILKLPQRVPLYHDGSSGNSLDALLARPDITTVIVVLPITIQPDVIRKAWAAGKHVLSEKPVAKDVAAGLALIKEYESQYKPKGLIWRVAENFEHEPGYIAAGLAIKAGKIGKVITFSVKDKNYIDQSSKWYNTPWRTVPDYQGGFLLDGGVHTRAALRVILPSAFVSLSGYATLTKDYLAPHDTLTTIVQSADGSHGVVEMTFALPTQSAAGKLFIITGTEGIILVDLSKIILPETGKEVGAIRVTITTVKQDKDGRVGEERTEVIEKPMQGVELELLSFFRAIDGSDDGLGTPFGTLQDVAFIEAGLNSNGSPVNLEKLVQQLPASIL